MSRRAFLKRSAAFGVAAAFGLAACSDDTEVFSSTTSTADGTTTTALTPTSETTVTEGTVGTEEDGVASETSLVAAGSELAVAFTYTADSSTGDGGVRNPYVAVWVEDSSGDLVDTIAVYYLQSNKGLRWISDLKRWYSVDGSDESLSTLSSATRGPGDYAVLWDCTDVDGVPVERGDYFMCIESAREHGPYSLIREAIAMGDSSYRQDLMDEGELNSASVQITIA